MARVTIADVAAAAGVDKATVSRALRGDGRISRATRDRVWSCARELGYRPDALARALSGQKSGLVALCLTGGADFWNADFLRRLMRVLSRAGLDALFFSFEEEDSPEGLARRLHERRVEAVLWQGDLPDDFSPSCPVVCLGGAGRPSDLSLNVDLQDQVRIGRADELGTLAGRLLVGAARRDGLIKAVTLARASKEDGQ